MLGIKVEAQSVQKALLEATKETKESRQFDAVKEVVMHNHNTQT